MKIEGHIPQKNADINADNIVYLGDAVRWFKNLYPDGVIDYVNGKEVVGFCELCGLPILEKVKYVADTEGITWHSKCPRNPYKKPATGDYLKAFNQYKTVLQVDDGEVLTKNSIGQERWQSMKSYLKWAETATILKMGN